MSEMVLLGAGASVEAGVPDTYGMTRKIHQLFQEDTRFARHAHVISFVIGGLLFQQGIKGENPLDAAVNVEELFNAVQLLGERNTLEAAPFVGSWHSMVQEFDRAKLPALRLDRLYRLIYESVTKQIFDALPHSPPAFAHQEIDRELAQTIKTVISGRNSYSSTDVGRKIGDYVMKITKDWMDKLKRSNPHTGHEFEREFRNAIQNMKDRPGEGEIFSECNELMINFLANIVWIENPEKVNHLNPLISLANTQKHLTIATLNYDNGIEQLAQSNQVKLTTGIDEWSKSGSFENSNEGVFLVKLHGSIDWALQRDYQSPEQPMPRSVIQRVPSEKVMESGFRPAVIFGQRNKLTVEGPFLDLLRAFQLELSHSTLLTVIGYSFRDNHVNEYISQWLNQSPDHKIRIISPNIDKNLSEYAQQLIQFCKDRIEIINETAGIGLAKLYSN